MFLSRLIKVPDFGRDAPHLSKVGRVWRSRPQCDLLENKVGVCRASARIAYA